MLKPVDCASAQGKTRGNPQKSSGGQNNQKNKMERQEFQCQKQGLRRLSWLLLTVSSNWLWHNRRGAAWLTQCWSYWSANCDRVAVQE